MNDIEVTYADANLIDMGVINPSSLDIGIGDTENDFTLSFPLDSDPDMDPHGYIYVEGTEYGGVIDKVNPNTTTRIVSYKGRTFQGVMASKIVCPDTGADYLIVEGEANEVIGLLLTRCGLTDLFRVQQKSSGIYINRYQFDRYVDLYSGLRSMLKASGAKLSLRYLDHGVLVEALDVDTITESFDSDYIGVDITKDYLPVNHLVCLGKGDLKDRAVVHLYADANGVVSDTQTFTGLLDNQRTYDYGSLEYDELVKKGTEKLQEYQDCDSCEAEVYDGAEYDIDDIIVSYDAHKGITVKSSIAKKILKISQRGKVSVTHQVSDPLLSYSR